MNAYPATAHSKAMLDRIVALLLALADLAELAGGRSCVVRTLVLLFLRPAEAVAQRHVMDIYGDTDIAPLLHVTDGDGSTAAIRLALSFRMLAMALAGLPEWVFDEWGGDAPQSGLRWPLPSLHWPHEVYRALRHMLARYALGYCDTS